MFRILKSLLVFRIGLPALANVLQFAAISVLTMLFVCLTDDGPGWVSA